MYTVTRQYRWPDGLYIVEISAGGIDYVNPDCLVSKYIGELETYNDAREAIKTAWNIATAWQADTSKKVYIGMGNTWAGSLSLDEMPLTKAVKRYLGILGRKLYAQAPKCAQCGELLPYDENKRYKLFAEYDDDDEYCSERCAEKVYTQHEEDNLTALCEGCGLDIEASREYAAENNLTFAAFAGEFYAGAIHSEI